MLRFIVFLLVASTLVFGAHAYLAWRLIGPSPLAGPWRTAAYAAVFLIALVQPVTFALRAMFKVPVSDTLSWIAFLCMGLFSILLTLTVMRDLGWLGAKAVGLLPADPERRRALLHSLSLGVLGAGAVLGGLGVYEARRRAAIVNVTVPIAGLPPELEGFRIVQITDVHVGPTIKRGFIDGIVDAVNSLNADMVAVTGDIVDGSVEELREHTAPFARMTSKHGSFYVTGNHEYYSGAGPWVDEMARLGMKPLMNAHAILSHQGKRVLVAGVTDYNAHTVEPDHRSDPSVALAGAPDSDVRVLLAHQPRSVFAAVDLGFHLQLSGHTHGGQFFPWMFFVRLQQPFTAGLHKLKDLWVYTSRGTGYWGPPVRLGAPAEITHLTLTRA